MHRHALLALLALLVAGALLGALSGAGSEFGDGLGFELFLALLALAIAARSPQGLTTRLGLGPSCLPWSVLVLLVVGMLSLSYALDGVVNVFELPHSDAIDQLESRLSGTHGRALSVALLQLALVPGVAEELLCRGLVQRGLQVRYGPATAIVLASLFFGALHMDPVYSLLAAVLGLYLGAIAYLAGSVRASIVCHAANNTAAVLGAAVAPEFGSGTPLGFAAAGAFSLWALHYAHHRVRRAPHRGLP
jgi:membrane protease YdiL (CAAX protease family)